MASNRELALRGRDILCDALDVTPPAPAEMVGAMAALAVPPNLGLPAPEMPPDAPAGATYPPDRLHDLLHDRYAIQVPLSQM